MDVGGLTMIIKITDSQMQDIKEEYKNYLKQNERPGSYTALFSDAFYPLRHDIGMNFWNIFIDNNSMSQCLECYKLYFAAKGRKSPSSDAHSYMTAMKAFKKFLDTRYGGVNACLKIMVDSYESVNKEYTPILKEQSKSLTTPMKIKSTQNKIDITEPCIEEIEKYLKQWDELENYSLQERALNKLFYSTYPNNSDIDDVLVKVSTLNDFYSTNIFSSFQVAKHIVGLNIDDRLKEGDVTLVNEIALVKMDNGSVKNFYSFATKYCSHHNPLEYPIYDSYVDKLLKYFRNVDGFYQFNNDEIKSYKDFKNILNQFRKFYGLDQFNLKEIDKYLWQLGKEKLPKNY